MKRSAFVLVVLLLTVIPARAQTAPLAQGTLLGTVRLHGAVISPDDLDVRVKSLVRPADLARALGDDDSDRLPEEPRGLPVRHGRVTASDDNSATLQFAIPGIVRGLPYRLSLRFRGRPGKVVWRVTDEGLVTLPAGDAQPGPIHIDGYVVTSEIEVLRASTPGTVPRWFGADALDFTDPAAAIRSFRWRSTLPGVTAARLEISTRRLTVPVNGRPPNPCDNTGLVYTANFAVQPDGWTAIPPVDFHAIVLGTRRGEAALPGVDGRTLQSLQAGGGLYVRAVPLDPDGAPMCNPDQNGVTGMVVVGTAVNGAGTAIKLAETPITLNEALYRQPQVSVHPTSGEVCYRTTAEHFVDPKTVNLIDPNQGPFANPFYDNYNHFLWTSGKVKPGTTALAGTFFCIYNAPSSGSWFDDFAGSIFDLVTGVVDAVSEMVNFASKLVDEVKAGVENTAAAGLEAIGIDCDDTCHKALEAGLEAGMIAMGVPPSLPNFDELMQGGVDYLADMAAEEVGVPPEVAEALANEGEQYVKATIADMKKKQAVPGLPDWLVPDIGLSPAVLTLLMSGPGFDFGGSPSLIRDYDSIFLGTGGPVKLPRQFGASPLLVVPMVLQPNLDGLPTSTSSSDYAIAVANKHHWVNQRLTNGCARFHAIAVTPPPAGVFDLFSVFLLADTTPVPFTDGFAECTP